MKDFICSFLMAVALIFLFSTNCSLKNKDISKSQNGIPQHLGNSGMVVQGNGVEFAEVVIPELQKDVNNNEDIDEEFSENSDTNIKDNEIVKEFNANIIRKDENYMNEMLLAFWHGVAAILIGEASALIVASVWIKIYKNNINKTKNT